MSSSQNLDHAFVEVVRAVGLQLAEQGFVRRGAVLQVKRSGNLGLIDFQRSTASSAEAVRFTVNLGVILGKLWDHPRKNARIMDAHVRQRLGQLLPNPSDRWWQLDEATEVTVLAGELSSTILQSAVPFIDRYLDPLEVISLWESGKSPGLTETQRSRLLSQLRARLEEDA